MATSKTETVKPPFLFSIRFILSLIAFLALAMQYSQKINMSVAIVCMINNTALKLVPENYTIETQTSGLINLNDSNGVQFENQNQTHDSDLSQTKKSQTDGPFAWPKNIQGAILSSYFIGYAITEIPGGYLSIKFGPKIVLAISYLLGSILTVLLPVFARSSYIALIACRFCIGLLHGVIWPAFAGFWASWAPPNERSRLIGLANAGSQIGNVITLPLGGFLCVYGFDGGWASIFYVIGSAGFVWVAIWWIFASDSPQDNRFIKETERDYVLEETKETRSSAIEGEKSAPWGAIMSSRPCLALFFGHSCSNWGTYLFLTSLPTYMKEVLQFDVKSNGVLSAIPYLAFWLFTILSSIIGDLIMSTGALSKSNVRKIFHVLAFFVPMLAVIGLIFVTCHLQMLGVVFLTIGLAFTGCGYGAGFLVNYNDISGSFSSITFGIGNTFATLPGIIAPYLVGVLTKNKKQEDWRIVFLITAITYLVGGIVLLIFSQAHLQPWASKKSQSKSVETLEDRF